MTREPVLIHPRRPATRQRREAVQAAQGRFCACGCGQWWVELDHRIPLALGGKDDASNWQGLAIDCHATKTRKDKADIARAKRRAGETCTKRGRPIRSRGFDKRLRKKLNGTVEVRA